MDKRINDLINKVESLYEAYKSDTSWESYDYASKEMFEMWYNESYKLFSILLPNDKDFEEFKNADLDNNAVTLHRVFGTIERYYGNLMNKIKYPDVYNIQISTKMNTNVFIVSAQDDPIADKVARFLDKKLNLNPIFLIEQPNEGKTIFQKLEDYTENPFFGVVIYSPIDEGRKRGDAELKFRARQNVVFEHGLLIGKLGKDRVCIIKNGEVEIPSDCISLGRTQIEDNWMESLRIEVDALKRKYRVEETNEH